MYDMFILEAAVAPSKGDDVDMFMRLVKKSTTVANQEHPHGTGIGAEGMRLVNLTGVWMNGPPTKDQSTHHQMAQVYLQPVYARQRRRGASQ